MLSELDLGSWASGDKRGFEEIKDSEVCKLPGRGCWRGGNIFNEFWLLILELDDVPINKI